MLNLLTSKLEEVLRSVTPLVAVICVLQVLFVRAPTPVFLQFLAGSLLAAVGMLLLFTGIDFGILPMGRYIGAELPKKGSLWFIAAVGFALGFGTTVAEPDVLILAAQVERVTDGGIGRQSLVYIVALGVGLFTVAAFLRVVWGIPMVYILAIVYSVMLFISFFAPETFIPMAYDAGSVTTGVLTTPVVLAVAGGLSTVLAGRSAAEDGFGLLGLASAGPIIAILIMGLLG